jgi:hypothetical protein
VTCGGDSGNRIFVLYWKCPLIRVSVIRGSSVYPMTRITIDAMETSDLARFTKSETSAFRDHLKTQ